MEDKKDQNDKKTIAPSNVIQFPSKKKEAEEVPLASSGSAPQPFPAAAVAAAVAVRPPDSAVSRKAKAILGGSVVAIMLASGAVNRYAFEQRVDSLELASTITSNETVARTIASIDAPNWERDAVWEKKVAEQLASATPREPASIGIGHAATPEENLRWGTLQEKYTIVYKSGAMAKPGSHQIENIFLQDETTNPAYVLDRDKFLRDFGKLFQEGFTSAKLKSVKSKNDKTIEAYTLFDKDARPKSEARFELDIHKRLLSLKVEPAQI